MAVRFWCLSPTSFSTTNEFFFHVFNTQAVRKAIHASASGVKVRHTSPTKIGEVIVSFPTSIKEQRAIVSVLADLCEETQRLVGLYARKLAALAALKRSLLHQAFAGGWDDLIDPIAGASACNPINRGLAPGLCWRTLTPKPT